ncbi:putative ribonuclease H-like domain-containing protein, partial [Tanacetum coccineum]
MDAKEKPSENAPKDNHVQDSEDVAEKEEQHNLTEAEQALKDDLEKLVTQEMIAKAMDDATRQAFLRDPTVYKVVKALYGLHQAPKTWYATLSTFLLKSGYKRVDIIFQMSSMGELTFFLRLQVKQKEDGIFISQDKYVAEILKKFDFASVKTASTPIETQKPLVKDEEASDVDV